MTGDCHYLLRVFDGKSINDVEGIANWYRFPRLAKNAGQTYLKAHSQWIGFEILRVLDGHYRTVATITR